MPPHPHSDSRSQTFPVPLKVTHFSLIVRRLDTLPPCNFGSSMAYNPNANYLVPVLEVRTPHKKNPGYGPDIELTKHDFSLLENAAEIIQFLNLPTPSPPPLNPPTSSEGLLGIFTRLFEKYPEDPGDEVAPSIFSHHISPTKIQWNPGLTIFGITIFPV